MSNTSEIKHFLIAVRALLSTRSHWTKKHSARDKNKKPVLSDNSNAVSFCAIGAICKVYQSKTLHFDGIVIIDILAEYIPDDFKNVSQMKVLQIAAFNDHPKTKHKDILSIFDQATNYL